MVSRQNRTPLLTLGEVMQLPTDEAVVMVSSVAPIKAKKLRYFADANFKQRVLPAACGQQAAMPMCRLRELTTGAARQSLRFLRHRPRHPPMT